ncbi:MAG: hypothetical protein AAFQ63_15825 [Cyanobacteria bacterium J06621_11]
MRRIAVGLLGGLAVTVLPPLLGVGRAIAQTPDESSAPTARYANGEAVDLADIITEWRGYYSDVPVYLCICQDGTCNQTEQWPYREYDRYQFGVALGPTNGQATEDNGFNCFDISDGSRPGNPRTFSTALTEATDATSGETVRSAIANNENNDSANASSAVDSTTAEPPISAPVSPPVSSPISPPESPAAPADTTLARNDIPTATTIDDGADIRLDWPSGQSNMLNVTAAGRAWNLDVINALDCESLSVVSEKTMSAQRVVGNPVVDQTTGYVAVPVLLDSCVDTDQMAVFVVDPSEGGAYELYRTQLPSVRGLSASQDVVFPNESSSYAYSTIVEMRYWDSTLLVRQADASGATVISIFRPGPTPAGTYAGCGVVSEGEGATALCNQ